MLRWCLSTVRVLGGVDRAQRTRLLSSSAGVHNACDNLAISAHLQVEEATAIPDCSSQEPGTPSLASCTRAISALKQLLTSPDPSRRPTPNTIRSLYISAKERGQLSQLDSRMLSALISLFGSLSVDPSSRCVYTSSLLPCVKNDLVTRNHWPFVKEVVSFKDQRRMTLAHSDRYWMMRAELGNISLCKQDAHAFGHSLIHARHQYLHFSRHIFDPEVHVPYLTALLSSIDPRHRRWVVDAMSSILRTHPFLHMKMLKVLWGVVHDTNATLLRSILSAVSFRVTRFPLRCGDISRALITAVPVDATTLTSALSAFPLPISSASTHEKAITELLHEAFSSGTPLVQQQRNILLCSMLYHCNGNEIPISSLDLPPDRGASMWGTLFGLAILEQVTQAAGSALCRDHALRGRIQELIRSLQDSWLHLVQNESHPVLISRVVATSFFRLAGAVADMKLFAVCLELSQTLGLWTGNSLDSLQIPQLNTMAAMRLAAVVQIQGCGSELIMKTLSSFATDVQHQSVIVSAAVEYLIHCDAELARTLYNVAVRSGRDIDVNITYALARTLPPPHAVHFLRDKRLSREQLGGLLSSIARGLKQTRRDQRQDAGLFVDIGNSLRSLYTTFVPPSHFRGHFQLLLLEQCTHGSGFQTTAIISSVVKLQRTFFQPSFLLQLTGLLLRRKQFRSALRMQKMCVDARIECADKLSRMVAARIWAGGRRRGSANICIPGCKTNTLFRGAHFLGSGTLFKSTTSSGPVFNRILQSLICDGRVHAAKVAFSRVAGKMDARSRTMVGNTLLHSVLLRPVPRNGRRFRKFLGLLENLVTYDRFTPDRITVNIVLKALIAWRTAFDYQRLRALFDHMVRGGYPAGMYSPSHLPFSTSPLRTNGILALSKVSAYISFEKHAKPMFKLFIKAFYLRNDIEAARTVVEILKLEQEQATLEREGRSLARLRGHMKAVKK